MKNCTLVPVTCYCRVSGGAVCTMARDQSRTHLESLMRECGSTEDQQVSHSCIMIGIFSKGFTIHMSVYRMCILCIVGL